MDSINELLSALKGKKEQKAGSEMRDDTLQIDCRSCRRAPDVRSSECIRCIVSNISVNGNAGRIKLRTSRDLELSGPAAELLCEMAGLNRAVAAYSGSVKQRACGDCGFSCTKIMGLAWAGFPDPDFDIARNKLMTTRPNGKECVACLQKTYRALDQTELGMKNLRKKISMGSVRNGGV